MGVHWKIWILVLVNKYIYIYIYIYIFSKKGELGQFADLRSGFAKKGGGVEGYWYPNVCYGKLNHRLTGFFLEVKL